MASGGNPAGFVAIVFPLPSSAAVAPLNHLLRGSGWALGRLQPSVGKTLRIRIPHVGDLSLAVQPSGEVAAVASSAEEDASLTVVPALLPRLLFHDEAAYGEIRVSGDSVFAAEILHIGKNLRWDAEQDLSGLIGDIAAHRVAQAGTSLVQWHAQTFLNLSHTLREYLTEEQSVLVRRMDVQAFSERVGALHDDVSRLEARMDALLKSPDK